MKEPTYSSAEDLVAGDLDLEGEDLDLPSGRKVRVRGLSRHELMFNGKGTEDVELIERNNVASCLVIPKLTIQQVKDWQRSSPAGGDFKVLSEKIRDLSGMGKGAAKSSVDGTGDDGP